MSTQAVTAAAAPSAAKPSTDELLAQIAQLRAQNAALA